MIIDNADDPSISLSEYFPISGDGSILINSRNAASRLLATVGSVKLGPMEQDTTIQLLLNAAGKVLDTESLEGTSAAKLSQALDGIPLAIDQIGRYIKVSGSTIEDARQVFEKLRHSGDISEYCWRQVSASVIICFNCIENIGTEESCDALDLLFFLSFISPDGVDAERLFERAWNNERVQERDRKFPEYHLRVLSNPMNLDWQPFRLRGALEILLSYSLVMRRGDENKISTHQTIHSYAHHRLTKHEMARYSSVTASTLAFAAGKDLETTGYVFREALLSHISFFLRDHNDDFAREIGLEDWAESLSSFARAFHDGRQYEKALEIETRAMKLRQRLLGGEHSDTLRSMIRIGRHLLSLGRPQEAGGIYQNVLQLQRKTLGGNHYPVEVEAMTCLANTHILLGRFPEAVSLLEKALSLGPRSSSYAEAEFVTITARYHLAVCYRQLGRYMEAVKLEQEALEWTTKILGANHLTTLTSMNNLAVTYGELGRADEAMWLSRQVLDTSRRVLGDRHPYTVTSMRNLAASCSKLGHYSDAEILFGQALDLAREQVDGYSNMLRAMAGLASVYGSLGRHGEALELGQKCLHLIEKHTTRGDLTLLAAMAELAMSEEKAGQYQNAVELGENMLELTKRELGPEHSISLTMMNGLATSYETIGQQSKAADLRDYVAELKKRNDGRSTATTAVDPTYTDFHEAESNSSDDHSACTEESMSQASSISSTTSYGSIQSDVVTPLIAAFESDLQLVFVYEDAMMVMSREKFIRYNVHCLKAFFTALHATTLEQRHAVRLLGSRKQRQLIAEEVCNKVPVNNTLITHPRETLDVDLMVDRFQLLGNPDGETEITLAEELQVSNDESEGSDQDNPTRSDQIDASDIKAMVNLFTNDNAFAQYKTSLQDFVHRQCSPRILRSVITLGNVHVMGGIIERHFDAIAIDEFEWLQELRSLGYGYYDIAEILMDDKNKSPWICFEQPKQEDVHIVPEYHRENCVHQGGKRSDLAPRLTTVDIENTEDIKKLIGEHCGLAGIAPKSRNVQDWTGLVNILGASNDTALITYDMHGTRYQLVSRVSEALQRFCGVASYLQRRGLCCTSFTVLRRTSTNDDVAIEIRQVNLHLASDLLTVLLLLVHNFESPGLIPRCLPRLKELADEIIDSVCNSENINEGQLDFRDCLDRVALAVQILTLGLYLYSQGHTGAVHPFFLMNPLSNIYLFGTQSVSQLPNALVQVSLCGLTCMAKVTGDRVMVFNSYRIPWFDNGTREFDLLASPEDLADTWDVWRFIADATAPYGEDIYAIEVGEGFISSEGEFYMWNGDAIPKLHWTRRAQPLKNTKPFGLHSKALIGTTTINVSCPVDEDSSWQIAHVTMGTLGTDLSYWERSEAQAGFQGGQYLIAQCNLTWAKRPGTTLKQKHLSNINLPFLESDWGLQISYCTGVARRVSLFHLLADVTPALIEPLLQKPSGWTALSTVHNMIGALKNADFAMWHDALEPELQADVVRIIQYVLLIFHDTGIDRSGENLVAIWPRKNDPLRCFKIPCKSVTSWARILTDSPDCATFAYVTSLCLETEDCKCRKLRDAPWHNKSMILDTAISRFINKGPTTVDLWILWHGECYLISTPEKDFLGTVSTSMTPATLHNPPRLYISPSTIPERFRPRVKVRIREKQCMTARAHGVVVLARSGIMTSLFS